MSTIKESLPSNLTQNSNKFPTIYLKHLRLTSSFLKEIPRYT